jgi:ATP-dependent DNA helicase RecG
VSRILPVNVEDLLYFRGVESARVEFKASWDEKVTGGQVLKTICAFANDLQNLNGGYIIIGVEEKDGAALMPPKGLRETDVDSIQKWIRGNCRRIDPEYLPVFSPEPIEGKIVLVLWVPASDARPHRVPEGDRGEKRYFVRIGSETIDAEKNHLLDQLLQLTAKIPFDDRRAQGALLEDMRESKVREFLREIDSGLLVENSARELYRKMRISVQVNAHDAPRNIGLLMFSENPENWFPCARIEVVQFTDGPGGNVVEEKYFRGGIHEQLINALNYIETLSESHIEKQAHSFKVKDWVSYPVQALREALVNAVYHRGYDSPREPVKVYLYPDRMEVISYPGPLPGITEEHLRLEKSMPPLPARNRRIGEFLKELKLAEGRATGLPKLYRAMRDNGSGPPLFDFDEGRSYFRLTLPAHPEYIAISAVRDAAHLRVIGNTAAAYQRIKEAWQRLKGSPSLTTELLRILGALGEIGEAEDVFNLFRSAAREYDIPGVTNAFVEVLLNSNNGAMAKRYMETLPKYLSANESLETAILARRLDLEKTAHRYFENAGEALLRDPRALHEFAQTKIKLAGAVHRKRPPDPLTYRRLLNEAKELLERVSQMEADNTRHAWAWRDLGRVKNWLKLPHGEVREAYTKAMELLPAEQRFRDEFAQLENDRPGNHFSDE